MVAGINLLCLTLATPCAVAAAAAAPPRNCAVAAATRPEDSSPLYTGKLEGEGTIHSIRRCPVDDGEGDQVGHRIYAVDASRRQQSLYTCGKVREGTERELGLGDGPVECCGVSS